MSCRSITPLLEAFNDGELGADKVLDVEQHLAECRRCVERVKLGRAVRLSVARVVRSEQQPSDAFRSRLAAALEASHQREWETQVLAEHADRSRMMSWRTILPVAAAAALTLVWAGSTTPERRANRVAAEYASADPTNAEAVIDELLNHHVRGRSQTLEPALLPQLEQEVGVPVRIPSLVQYGARWEGGSVVPVRNQRAASLRYKLGNHRVTLYVYDSSRVPIEKRLEQRLVGDEPVYVGSRRGYSIGAIERRGVGYAMASDLNDAETAEIVAALY